MQPEEVAGVILSDLGSDADRFEQRIEESRDRFLKASAHLPDCGEYKPKEVDGCAPIEGKDFAHSMFLVDVEPWQSGVGGPATSN